MNELAELSRQLPDTIEDLAKFALIGREKLVAVRAEIRAIDKVGLAQEVYQQKLEEGKEIGEAVLDAEVKLGELIKEIPKATKDNNKSGKAKNDTQIRTAADLGTTKPKKEILKEAGIKQGTAEKLQHIARHPEAVEQAKREARERDEIVTRAAVEKIIRDQRKPKDVVETVKERVEERQKEIESSPTVELKTLKAQKDDQEYLDNREAYDIWKEFQRIRREFDRFSKTEEGKLRTAFFRAGMWGLKQKNDLADEGLKYNYEEFMKATNKISNIILEVMANGIQPKG